MAKILVIAEQRGGKLKKGTLECLGASAAAGNETHALLIGSGIAGLANELAGSGASNVHLAEDASAEKYNGELYAKTALAAIQSLKPDAVLMSATPMGKDLLPRVAAMLDVGLASDCVSLGFDGGKLKCRRPLYSGKATAEVEFVGAGPQMASIRPNAVGLPKADPSKTAATAKVAVDSSGVTTKTLDLSQGSSSRPDVTEASIVVSGGRSLKNTENFKILEEMADVLGAAVGASRAAVDAGYRPHRDQVGQTGKTVSPTLYIACGISGAIQHLAGMRTSKTIVAINTDPEAPIFQVADYGIVGDLFQVVPVLTQEFKKLKG